MSEEIGEAVISIDADGSPFRNNVDKETTPAARRAGDKAGDAFGKGMLSRFDDLGEKLSAKLSSSLGKALKTSLSALAPVTTAASLIGPLTTGVLALADGVALVASNAAAMTPALALAPSVIGGWQFLQFTLAGIGEQMGEALKPLGEQLTKAQEGAGRLASKELPALGAAFQQVNLPNIADSMNRIGESTGRSVGIFGNWVNSAPGIQLIKDTTDGVASAFERAAVPIAAAAISLGNMANRADVVDRLTSIGDAIGRAADRFNAWTDSVTSADIDGAFEKIGDAAQFVTDKVGAVRDVIIWLADHQSVLTGISDAFAGMAITFGLATGNWVAVAAGAVTLVLNHFDRVAPAVKAMADKAVAAFHVVANDPWVQAIAADVKEIAGLIRDDFAAGIDWLGDRWDELKPKVSEAWAVLGPVIDQFLKDENVRAGLRAWADGLGILVVGFVGLSAAAVAFSASVPAVLGGFAAWVTGTFVNKVTSGFQKLVSFVGAIPEKVSSAWDTVTSKVSSAVDRTVGFFEKIPEKLSSVWQTVQSKASSAWQTVVDTVAAVPDKVLGYIGKMASQAPYLIGYMVGQVVGFFVSLGVQAVAAIIALPGRVADLFNQTKDRAVSLITSTVSTVVSTATTLPGKVSSAISSLASTVAEKFTSAKNQAVTTTTSLVSTVVSTAQGLPGKVASAISALASNVAAKFIEAKNRAVTEATALVNQAISIITGLPGRAASALGNLGNILASAGRQLIQGFIDGIRSAIPNLDGVLSGITSRIPDLKGPPEKDAKLLRPAGQLVMRGFRAGIEDERPVLERQLTGVTGTIGKRSLLPGGAATLPRPAAAPAPEVASARTRSENLEVTINLAIDDLAKLRTLDDFLAMLDNARVNARKTRRSGRVAS